MERLIFNEWTISGEVSYLKVFDEKSEFGASAEIKGVSKRRNSDVRQRVDFSFIMEHDIFEKAKAKGFDKFKYVTVSGHIETWIQQGIKRDKTKTRFICDDIIEVVNG